MPFNKRILVAVDTSNASRLAVRYVADLLAGSSGFHVGLIHLELPPRMLEWGGSDDPAVEDRVSEERAEDYREMEGTVIESGQELLQQYQRILAERQVDVAAQLVQLEEPLDATHITNHILKTARDRDYCTVAVGRNSFTLLQRLFRHHVGEELLRQGHGIAVWVVE
jgi:nucleotide-binding universal stress UspA family protein